MQIGLLEPDKFSADARAILSHLGDVRAWSGTDLPGFLAPLDALFVRLAHRIDRRMLDLAPRLRWLCSPTTGHDHLDEAALQARGITVLSLRGERAFLDQIHATPEHTFGLILAVLRRYGGAFASTSNGSWNRDQFRGEELFHNRVGIVGLGRVGYHVATYCEAFGAEVCWYDPQDVLANERWTRATSVETLIESSRIIVLCASLTPGQPPVLGPAEIARLNGHYLVNTARGELVDETALFETIRQGRLAGVATDVIADEIGASRLDEWRAVAEAHNVILTPHIGGATASAMACTERFIADRLARRVSEGKRLS